jgi:hypothetical protein
MTKAPQHDGMAEEIRLGVQAFILETASIERDARVSELTRDEIEGLVHAVLATRALQPAAPEQIAEGEGWQPISTAPRDGTRIIVTRTAPTGRNPAKIVWGAEGAPQGWRWRQQKVIRFEPTHWRPLPAPPTNESAGQ